MKSNIFKYIFFTIVLILMGLSIYIIYKDENNEAIVIEDNKLKIKTVNEINIGITSYDTINPIISKNRDIQYVTKLVFDPLVDITKDFRIQNKLAKEFSKINEATYIIKLREDIYWHDNTKFTAADVIFTINNLKKESINSIYRENVKGIKEVVQIDDYTIKIILENEIPFFEYYMCFPILSYTGYEENSMQSKYKIPIGTGKYKIESIDEDSVKLVITNKDYKTNIKRINIKLEKNPRDLYNNFSRGELDYIVTDSIDYENYLGTMGYNVYKTQNRQIDYLALNNNNKILNSKEVRKALNMALDKNSINYIVFNNKYLPCSFPIYNSYLIEENEINTYNINKAKSILIENKKNIKSEELSFNLVVNKENKNRVAVANLIKEQLSKSGITINVIETNNDLYSAYLKNKTYDIILTGNIISNSPNLETYFGKNNLSNYKNESINQILKDITNMDEEKIRKERYKRIQEIYNEDMPFICLYSNSLFILTNSKLKGDMSCNWFNLFYNIDNWYKVE